MKVYLHIGTHKTGTTTIQNFCACNQDFLASHGIFWPGKPSDGVLDQYPSVASFVRRGDPEVVKAYISRGIAAAEASSASSLLLSAEAFCQFGVANVKAFAAMLPGGCELEVIVYFRNIYDFAVSSLNEMIKIVPKPVHNILTSVERGLEYDRIIQTWETVAPGRRLHVCSYEEEKHRLTSSFLERLGVPAGETATWRPPAAEKRNESLDLATQLMLSVAGYSNSVRDFNRVRTAYKEAFDGVSFDLPATSALAEALCPNADTRLQHARLAPFRDGLLARRAPARLSDADLIDYLDRLSRFTANLAQRGYGPLRARPKNKGLFRKLFRRA